MTKDLELETLLTMQNVLLGGQLCSLHQDGRAGLYGEITEIAAQTVDILVAIDVRNKGRNLFFIPRHFTLSQLKLGGHEMFIAWSWNKNEREKFIFTPKQNN